MYTTNGYGSDQGLYKSVDGGVNWTEMLGTTRTQTTGDVYSIQIDPNDHQHLLVGFHSDWPSGTPGVIESKNGGASWIVHPPQPSWGHGHYVFFITSTTWLIATQDDGFWRTTNSGQSWNKVADQSMSHGGDSLYRGADGALYTGASQTLLRSTNDGESWTEVGFHSSDGYYAVIGDGTNLWSQPANTGFATANPQPPYYTSPVSDGTTWSPYHANETFPENGPMSMAFDPANGIIYSSNWRAGVWRLKI